MDKGEKRAALDQVDKQACQDLLGLKALKDSEDQLVQMGRLAKEECQVNLDQMAKRDPKDQVVNKDLKDNKEFKDLKD